MNTLSLELGLHYKIVIRSDNESILDSFKRYLYTHEIVKFRIKNKKTGETWLKEEKREYEMYTVYEDSLLVDAGLIDYIAIHVSSLYRQFGPENLKLDYRIAKPPILPITEKWKKIFSTHPRGQEFADNQTHDFPVLMASFGGILEVFTSYGKTEMMLACIQSMLEHATGNIVVLIPDLSIQDEIMLRSKKWDVPISIYDWNERVNLIQPVGFLRSKQYNDQSKAWLGNVTQVLTDECHHLSAKSWGTMFDNMPKVERSYGFSASVDVSEGSRLSPGSIVMKDLGPKSASIIAKCGSIKISRKLPVPVSILRISCSIAAPETVQDSENWQEAYDATIVSPNLASIIARIFYENPDRNFFIPIHKKESGLILYHGLMHLTGNGIYWGDELIIDGSEVKPKTSKLEHIKKVMNERPRRCIIGTRFEGHDIPNLNAIIPLTGTSHRMVLQPVGRAARGKDCLIALISDRNNPVCISQSAQRLERIEKEYIIVSNRRVKM